MTKPVQVTAGDFRLTHDGANRAARGGEPTTSPAMARVPYRLTPQPDVRFRTQGFRLVWTKEEG